MRKNSSIENRGIRVVLIVVSISLLFLLTIIRLVQIQIIDSPKYTELARLQYQNYVPLPPARGLIFDRKNNLLVSNSVLISLAADPSIAKNNLTSTSRIFSQVFNKPINHYKNKLSSKKKFIWLEKNIPPVVAEKIIQKKLPGIIPVNTPRRLFFNGGTAVQTIGITNFENIGKSGIEYQYNKILSGDSGFVILQRDGLGKTYVSIDYPRQEPKNGNSLQLTLDLEYQTIAEEELKKGIDRTQADAGCVIMVNPKTGEILANANYPTFDPSVTRVFEQEALKNRSVTELYEPGSLFKVITVSAGLTNNSITPEQKFFAENGKYVVQLNNKKSRIIEDSHPLKGDVTVTDALTNSSNIVMAKISNVIGAEQLYTHARSFGFGFPTNVEIPNEASGELKKPFSWSITTLNNMSFGYELNSTPLQLAMAYSVIANGGLLLKPFIIKNVKNEEGEIIESNETKLIRRVISADVAETLKEMLKKVVDEGTGSGTKLTDLPIAGKTGTARKFVDGEYKKGFYNALFAGFYPADDPEIVCVVLLENPKGEYYGGTTSAIIFRGIAEQLHRNKGFFNQSKFQIAENKFEQKSKNNISTKNIYENKIINPSTETNNVFLPNVCGLTLRKAISILKSNNLTAKFSGTGIVVNQNPIAGSEVTKGSTITLGCTNNVAVFNSNNFKNLSLKN
ncbi:MAG: penicillin-binding protein [Bacteroidetes bacterium]|nr:penicillin-binding protein [Bacteroidota bacterium]